MQRKVVQRNYFVQSRRADYFNEGFYAYLESIPMSECPYQWDAKEVWERGWMYAEEQDKSGHVPL